MRYFCSNCSYVRKGFGNQLVRDMKTSRGLANEKVRWSLHNARFRKAKKQAYCVYYTRFGQCKRGDDKCLYIHDRDKVAVCTKFLRGLCSDPKCTLTHKVVTFLLPLTVFATGACTVHVWPVYLYSVECYILSSSGSPQYGYLNCEYVACNDLLVCLYS